MTSEELREAIRAAKAREAADPHRFAGYRHADGSEGVAWSGDVVATCACGWSGRTPTTGNRAHVAWEHHHRREER